MAITKDNIVGAANYLVPAFGFQTLADPLVDTDFSARPFRSVRTGGAGDVKITGMDGVADIIPSSGAGERQPVMGTKIWASGTTATKITLYF